MVRQKREERRGFVRPEPGDIRYLTGIWSRMDRSQFSQKVNSPNSLQLLASELYHQLQ